MESWFLNCRCVKIKCTRGGNAEGYLAISQYEEKILKYLDQLDSCIEADAKAGRISEISDLFYWFGFDTMGDFVFNKSFDMLRNQQWHHIIIRLQRALSLLGPLSPAPWLVQVGFKLIPPVGVLKDWFDMVSWCEKQMRERISVGRALREKFCVMFLSR